MLFDKFRCYLSYSLLRQTNFHTQVRLIELSINSHFPKGDHRQLRIRRISFLRTSKASSLTYSRNIPPHYHYLMFFWLLIPLVLIPKLPCAKIIKLI